MTTLVLLPGMDGTGELFAGLADALSPTTRARVVAYPPDRPLGYAALTDLVRTQLPAAEPFVLLGESFSGPVAVALAAEGAPGLRGLILCCSFAKCPRPAMRLLRPLTGLPGFPLPPVQLLAEALLGRDPPPALRDRLARAVGRVSPETMRARLRAVIDVDVTAALGRVRVPVLYLRALRDRVVPRAAGDLVAAHAPGTRIVNLDAPHLLLQCEPASSARAIEAFVA